MTQINQQNYKNYNAVSSPAVRTQNVSSTVRLPDYYDVPESYGKESFKDMFKDSPVYSMFLKPFVEHPIAVLLSWLGLGYGIDKYAHACGGKYESSLVGKIAKFGDKIQESPFIQNKPVQTVLGWFGSAKKAGGKVVNKSAVLRGMRDTHSMPEWNFVKSQMFNQQQEVAQDFIKVIDSLKLDTEGIPKLEELGLDKKERQYLKKYFNVSKLSQLPEEKAVNQILLSRLGKTDKQIEEFLKKSKNPTKDIKNLILKEMDLEKDKIKLIKDDVFGKYLKDVENAAGKVAGKVKIGGGHYKWLGFLTKPFERTIGCDEIHNKLHSLSDGAKTGTGRFLSKFVQMIHRSITFGQGKLAALVFIAPMAIEVGVDTIKADDDQKFGTAIGGAFERTSWIITWPIAARLMHVLGGAQYAGMSKEQVEEYRKILNEFNERTQKKIKVNGIEVPNEKVFKSYEEYKHARSIAEVKLNRLKTVDKQNIFTSGIRKLTRFFMMDLETFKGCNSGSFFQNLRTKIPYWVRNTGGVPMRVIAFFALAMGVFDETVSKIIAKIFGKSYDSMKHDELKADRKAQRQFLFDDLNKRMYDIQKQKQMQNLNARKSGPAVSMRGKPDENVFSDSEKDTENTDNYSFIPSQKNTIKEEIKENKDNYTYIPSQNNIVPPENNTDSCDDYTYIPSQDNIINDDAEKNPNKRSYVPSQAAANIVNQFDNSGLEGALRRADRAEAFAIKVLNGDFEKL